MDKLLFDIEKINLIIKLAKPIIEKSGSYKIINNMTSAEEVELRKHFNMEFLYSISGKNAYLLKSL
jgi:transposase